MRDPGVAPAVRSLIREGKNHRVYSAMEEGSQFRVQTMDAALVELVRKGAILCKGAQKRSSDPETLTCLMGGGAPGRHGDGIVSKPGRAGGYGAFRR